MSDFKYSLTNLKPVEPAHKIALTFPDGATREFPKNTTGLDIAKGISPSLAKRTVAMALDGTWSISPTRSSTTRKSNSSPATIPARWN